MLCLLIPRGMKTSILPMILLFLLVGIVEGQIFAVKEVVSSTGALLL